MNVHQVILDQLHKNVFPYVMHVHGPDIPYLAELWVGENPKFEEGVVSFHIGEDGHLIAEYTAYDTEYMSDSMIFPLLAHYDDCKLVILDTQIEIPIRIVGSNSKTRTIYSNIKVPNVVTYECIVSNWLGNPENKMDSASIFMTGLPNIHMPSYSNVIEDKAIRSNLYFRRKETGSSVLRLLEAGDWNIRLEQIESDPHKSSEHLYIATISRNDELSFTLDENRDILLALRTFLSFQSGSFINTHLIVCFSKTPSEPTERAFISRLTDSSFANINRRTATDIDTWPYMFERFWKLYTRKSSHRLENAILHYVMSATVAENSQSAGYAIVPARSTLEALVRWWNDLEYDFQFSAEEGKRFTDLLLKAINRADLGRDSGSKIDIEEVRKVIEGGTHYRNVVDHGTAGDIQDEDFSRVIAHQLYLHNLTRLLISAKLGIRDTHSRGSFYHPKFGKREPRDTHIAELSPDPLSSQEKIIMDKINALGIPLGDWDVETDCLVQAMRANSFTSHDNDSDLLKYVHAITNSSLIRWFLQSLRPPMKEGEIEPAPIPKIPAAEQRPFIHLVDQILEAKAADPDADTSELKESIDWLVYDLYDLADEETVVVADYFWDGDMTQEEEDAVFVRMMEEALQEEGFVSREEIMAILRGGDEG